MTDDMRINIVATSTGFEELGGKSVTSVNTLSTAAEKLIRQLERQAGVLAAGAAGWKLYTTGLSGMGEEQQKRIIELQEFISKHKLLKDSVEASTTAQERFNAATSIANSGRAYKSPTQLMEEANATGRSGKQADYDKLFGAVTGDKEDPFLSGMKRWQENDDTSWERGMRDIKNRNDKKRAEQAESKSGRWAGLEGFRAVEDFAQGSAYGGIRGGILAASNNLSQMGAAYGAYGGMVGAAISTTIILGSTAVEAWRKNSKGARDAAEATEHFTKNLTTAVAQSRSLLEIDQERRGVKDLDTGGAKSRTKSLENQIERYNHDLKFGEEMAEKLKGKVGASGVSADDLQQWRDERVFRQQEVGGRADPLSGVSGAGRAATAWENRMSQVKPEALTDEFIKTQRELEQSRSREIAIRDKLMNTLQKEVQKQLEKRQREDREIGQDQADRNSAVERSRRVGGVGPLTEWEQMDKERASANERNAKDKTQFEGGQSWYQNRKEELMLAGMKKDEDRAAYRAEKAHQESLRRSAEAERRGIITPGERSALDADSLKNRDKEMRLAKYGNIETGGHTGYNSEDVRSVGGANDLLMSIKSGQQMDWKAQLLKNGDIAEQQLTAQQQLLEYVRSGPTGETVF